MKKILVVCPRFPYPVVGGDKLRIYNMCRVLAMEHQVTLVSFCESKEELFYSIPDDGVFKEVHRVFLPKWKSWLNTLRALFARYSLQVAYYDSPAMSSKVNDLLSDCDIVIAHLIRTASYVYNADKYKILEMTDAISLNYERVRQIAKNRNLRSVIYGLEVERLKQFEQEMISCFDRTILVSDVDREYLSRRVSANDAKKIMVCSNGVDVDALPYNFFPDGKTIVFIGNMVTLQNLDAAEYFSSEIFPRILIKHPDAIFKIVGKINQADMKRFQAIPSVSVTGAVASIADTVAGASVGVCPMRLGAGIQNKILEYMALGIPAVISSMGFEGLQVEPGRDVIVADEPELVANSIVKILENPLKFEPMAFAARKYVEQNHSWVGKMQPLFSELM